MTLLEHVVATKEQVLADDQPGRLTSQQALAVAYYTNGQMEEALSLLDHVVAIASKASAPCHPYRITFKESLTIVRSQVAGLHNN